MDIMEFMNEAMATLLRERIAGSGLSENKLGPLVGVKQQTLSCFMRGKGISLFTAEKLARYFNLVLEEKDT